MVKQKATGTGFAGHVRNNPAAAASLGVVLLLVIAGGAEMTSLGAVISNLRALAWWAVILAAALSHGSLFMKITGKRANGLDPGIHLALAAGTGLWFLAMESFFLGLAGFFTTRVLTGLVPAAGFLSFLTLWIMGEKPEHIVSAAHWKSSLPVTLLMITLALSTVFVLVPPVFFDAMTYHLELPSRYLMEGRIVHVPENLYSGYPQVTEMLYGIGLAIGGVSLAGLLSLTAFALTLFLMLAWGRSSYGDDEAAWGTLFLALTPPLLVTVGFFQNDWLMTFFIIGTIALLKGGDRDVGRMALAGSLAGMAAGCKYTALAFGAGIPFVAGLYDDRAAGRKTGPFAWGVFWLSFIAAASPWYLKNYFFTGDPMYPLFSGLLAGKEGVAVLAADTHFSLPTFADLLGWLAIPLDLLFKPLKYQMQLSAGLIPLVLLPTLFSLRGKRPAGRFIGAWMTLSLITWYFTFRVARFALPMLVIVFLWFGVSFTQTVKRSDRPGSILKGIILLLLFSNLGTFLGFQSWFSDNVGAAFHTVPYERYLEDKYPPYEAIKFLNTLDPAPKKVLFVGEMRGFYSQFPREVATFDLPNRLIELVRAGKTNREIASRLADAGFTHILFNPGEMKRLGAKSPWLRLATGEEERLREFFVSNTRTLMQSRGILVIKILP